MKELALDYSGTDLGETAGRPFPPTGKKIDFIGTNIFHLEGDMIVDEHVYYDVLGVLLQMGLIPESAE